MPFSAAPHAGAAAATRPAASTATSPARAARPLCLAPFDRIPATPAHDTGGIPQPPPPTVSVRSRYGAVVCAERVTAAGLRFTRSAAGPGQARAPNPRPPAGRHWIRVLDHPRGYSLRRPYA